MPRRREGRVTQNQGRRTPRSFPSLYIRGPAHFCLWVKKSSGLQNSVLATTRASFSTFGASPIGAFGTFVLEVPNNSGRLSLFSPFSTFFLKQRSRFNESFIFEVRGSRMRNLKRLDGKIGRGAWKRNPGPAVLRGAERPRANFSPQGSLQTRSKCGRQGPPSAWKHTGPGHAAKRGAERPTASTNHLGNAWMEETEEGRRRQARGKRPRGAHSAQGATFVSEGAYKLTENVMMDTW